MTTLTQLKEKAKREYDKLRYRNTGYYGFVDTSATSKCLDDIEHIDMDRVESFLLSQIEQAFEAGYEKGHEQQAKQTRRVQKILLEKKKV